METLCQKAGAYGFSAKRLEFMMSGMILISSSLRVDFFLQEVSYKKHPFTSLLTLCG